MFLSTLHNKTSNWGLPNTACAGALFRCPWFCYLKVLQESVATGTSLITHAAWAFDALWWGMYHLYQSWEQANKISQIVPLFFWVFSSVFNCCNKMPWCKLYVSVGIGKIKMHSNSDNDLSEFSVGFFIIIYFKLQSRLHMTLFRMTNCRGGNHDICMKTEAQTFTTLSNHLA